MSHSDVCDERFAGAPRRDRRRTAPGAAADPALLGRGGTLPGESDSTVLAFRSPKGARLSACAHPTRSGWHGRGFTGALDVEGDPRGGAGDAAAVSTGIAVSVGGPACDWSSPALRRAPSVADNAAAPVPADRGAPPRSPPLAGSRPARLSATTTNVSNEFYRLVLGPSLVYSCAYFETPQDTPRSRAAAQARDHLPQAATSPRRATARQSAADGDRC